MLMKSARTQSAVMSISAMLESDVRETVPGLGRVYTQSLRLIQAWSGPSLHTKPVSHSGLVWAQFTHKACVSFRPGLGPVYTQSLCLIQAWSGPSLHTKPVSHSGLVWAQFTHKACVSFRPGLGPVYITLHFIWQTLLSNATYKVVQFKVIQQPNAR